MGFKCEFGSLVGGKLLGVSLIVEFAVRLNGVKIIKVHLRIV